MHFSQPRKGEVREETEYTTQKGKVALRREGTGLPTCNVLHRVLCPTVDASTEEPRWWGGNPVSKTPRPEPSARLSGRRRSLRAQSRNWFRTTLQSAEPGGARGKAGLRARGQPDSP